MLILKRFICGPLDNNVYVIADEASLQCAVIDPGADSGAVIEHVQKQKLDTRYVLLTHGHFDHALAVAQFCRELDAPLAVHPGDVPLLAHMAETAAGWGVPGAENAPVPGLLLTHGQVLKLGESEIEVRHTPGHSPGQVAFVYSGNAVVGDTLFRRAIGRYDLPGSDVEALMASIRDQLYSLPGDTIVWPGHGPETTIDEELRLNPYIGDGARFGLIP